MTYQQAIDYLYSRLPIFQNQGARAYKPGLTTTREFCNHLSNPQNTFRSIHIGGTNGKGSTSHMIASVLQAAGYKVGLYTSPHLKSFTERIRINGLPVDEEYVSCFVEEQKDFIESIHPSFFEVTVAMAFSYFAREKVDVAVIEVGMGGRLDSTNIITPVLSLVTNISFDHMQYLGDTLPKIAGEKAGIIKAGVPFVLTERADQDVQDVFRKKADEMEATFYLADDLVEIVSIEPLDDKQKVVVKTHLNKTEKDYALELDLLGLYQQDNIKGVLIALEVLQQQGFKVSKEAILAGLRQVKQTTGLKGRWQVLQKLPWVICDTAHNFAGLSSTLLQLKNKPYEHLRFVLGFVADKDLDSILGLFPDSSSYYFCQPSNPRAYPVDKLLQKASNYGLNGEIYEDVNAALESALKDSSVNDCIYVGGSTFVVADLNQL